MTGPQYAAKKTAGICTRQGCIANASGGRMCELHRRDAAEYKMSYLRRNPEVYERQRAISRAWKEKRRRANGIAPRPPTRLELLASRVRALKYTKGEQ